MRISWFLDRCSASGQATSVTQSPNSSTAKTDRLAGFERTSVVPPLFPKCCFKGFLDAGNLKKKHETERFRFFELADEVGGY